MSQARTASAATSPGQLATGRVDVARACRVLAAEGLVSDILGHVSLRVGDRHMLIRARSASDPGLLLTRPEDVVLTDLDGEPAEELAGRQLPQELPIHGEVLRARSGDGAVVHAHPPDVVLCSIADLPLRPVFGAFNIPAMRMAEQGLPVFDYYGLVKSRERGEQMAAAMAGTRAVVLRGHGLTTAAPTLAGAVVTALNVNLLARMTVALVTAGRSAPEVPVADRADLPDLGAAFNDELVWRHHVAKLSWRGLGLEDPGR
ncbi:MAG: class II aldolase/adducin family protein [Actinomycetota bacterium]|nr:class II aldolase/adducin family protein [Actinomycetota bacterium]